MDNLLQNVSNNLMALVESSKKEKMLQSLKQNTNNNQVRQRFSVQSNPKDKFPLFDKNDFYHYEKRFHNELPSVIIPPISFHLNHSVDNFCNLDARVGLFGLGKTVDILTDPRLNTNISNDLLDNSLNILLPDRKALEKNQNLREEIINILDRKDETIDTNLKKAAFKSNASLYMRASTLMSSVLSLKKKSSGTILKPISTNTPSQNLANIKLKIEKSFENIKNIEDGFEHPHKPGLKATRVYNINPFVHLSGEELAQVIFPNDPVDELQPGLIDTSNSSYKQPENFLLKKIDENGICSFYKNESIVDEDIALNELNQLNQAEIYSHERDYILNLSSAYENFNRFFIFLNKNNKTAQFASVDKKMFLKKYKKVQHMQMDNEDFSTPVLTKKRERDIVVVPTEISKDRIREKNEELRAQGINKEFVRVKVGKVDYTKIERIREMKNEGVLNEGEEEEDLFGESEASDKEGSQDN